MKKFAFLVTTPPHSNLTTSAISLIEATLKSGSEIVGVFFYQDGVLNASQHLALPNDEYQTIKQWQMLHQKYQLALHLCISAGEKRGLSDEIIADEIPNNNQDSSNINDCFTISGLGELVELSSRADRVIQL